MVSPAFDICDIGEYVLEFSSLLDQSLLSPSPYFRCWFNCINKAGKGEYFEEVSFKAITFTFQWTNISFIIWILNVYEIWGLDGAQDGLGVWQLC